MNRNDSNWAAYAPLKITRKPGVLLVGNDLYTCEFDIKCAGLPTALAFAGEDDCILREDTPILRGRLRTGAAIRPFLAKFAPSVTRDADAVRIGFDDVSWSDLAGRMMPGYRTALMYEFHPDGTVFVDTFFFTETTRPRTISAFTLEPAVSVPADAEANWAYWQLPQRLTGQIIQDASHFERNLTRRDQRQFPGTIIPFVSFDMGAGGRRDRHIEFFVESWNSLTLNARNTATSVNWNNRKAVISWSFQRRPLGAPGRAYQWHNTWGWCLRRFPIRRRSAPLRVFHYLDNFRHYPDSDAIRQAAQEGANVLILHEGWRLNLKAGETPYDRKRLKEVAACCHKNGLRLGLYVRGNEPLVREQYAAPLREYLERNRDGIYMDFGSPICYLATDENAPGGRVGFREYYRMTRGIRDFVGAKGFFIGHSGSFFAALAYTTVDAYLGGEQEKGLLLKNPTVHAYFSGLSVAPPSLWTGAFPTYRTKKVLPYLAGTLQAPFAHFGTQFPVSSLAHPPSPALVTFARPLWRFWELFDGRERVRAYSTQCGGGVFTTDSSHTGASLMVDGAGNALLLAANLADHGRRVALKIRWQDLGIHPGRSVYALTIDGGRAVAKKANSANSFAAQVEGRGLAGWLVVKNASEWKERVERFCRPFPSASPQVEEWQAHLKSIYAARFAPAPWKRSYLRVSVPNFANSYEDSIWFDLYENTVELMDITRPERPRRLGILSRRGVSSDLPSRKDLLWPGVSTPWLPLHRLLGTVRRPGVTRLALKTRRGKNEFYSWIKAELSPVPRRVAETRDLIYTNDIDLDWSRLTFNVRLEP